MLRTGLSSIGLNLNFVNQMPLEDTINIISDSSG